MLSQKKPVQHLKKNVCLKSFALFLSERLERSVSVLRRGEREEDIDISVSIAVTRNTNGFLLPHQHHPLQTLKLSRKREGVYIITSNVSSSTACYKTPSFATLLTSCFY